MSNETQMSKETEGVKAANAEKPEFLLTTTGVMILGANLIGDKMTSLLCEMIKLQDADGLALAEFRADNWPKEAGEPVFGMAYADTHSFSVNLQRCWDSAVEDAEKGECLGFLAMLWINVLQAIGHEIDHLNIAYVDRDLYENMRGTEEGSKDLEITADETAADTILDLARQFDVEPSIEDLGWFGIKIMSLMTDDDTKALDWVCKLRKQLEDGVIYDSDAGQCFTLREFLQQSHATDEEWPQNVTAINLSEYLEDDVVITHRGVPVNEPVAETVVLEKPANPPETVVLTPAETPADAIVMAALASGQFVGAGEADNGEPDIVLEAAAVATANAAAQDVVIQALMDGPAPANESPETIAAETVVAASPVIVVEELARTAANPVPTLEPTPQVAAVNAQVAAAAAIPPAVETEPSYTPNNLSPEVMAATMKAVWQTLHHHIFTKCGWQQNPQTGRFTFTNSAAVLEGVDIASIIALYGAENFIMSYDTLTPDGQGGSTYAAEAFEGRIRGRFTQEAKLPSYQLYINVGGQRFRRSYTPQNPEKRDSSNAYKPTAEEAAAGGQIAWVFKGEAPKEAGFTEKCAAKLNGNQYETF